MIAASTRKRWGSDQAASYIAALRKQIKSLCEFSERFPEAEEGYRGLRKMRSGHHLVFYLIGEDTIEIICILHERMDAGLQLD